MAELPTYPFSDDGLRDALLALCPDVAGTLRKYGIKGEREDECACPVANYLLRAVEGINEVVVDYGAVKCAGPVLQGEQDIAGAAIPDAVEQFVIRFDAGCYPDLDVEVPSAA